jgi:hypothetical protein
LCKAAEAYEKAMERSNDESVSGILFRHCFRE